MLSVKHPITFMMTEIKTLKGKAGVIKRIRKREGNIVPFDITRISNAISKAMIAAGEGSQKDVDHITRHVLAELLTIRSEKKDFVPTVEQIQDVVEEQLILEGFAKTAKAYILYRKKRAELREKGIQVPEKVRTLALESKQYFRNSLGEFIYYRTYSRWIEEEGRRETWIESVTRYMDFMRENIGTKLSEQEYEEIRHAIINMEVMPSMRLLWSAGKAARKTNVTAYNCSYIAPTKLQDFGEIMYLSMCGTGVGFSVESQTVQQLPIIKHQTGEVLTTHVIGDSKEGWADALVLGLKTWFSGKDIAFDYSQLRPRGARLKTMGGQSSGPEPLKAVLDFAREKVLKKQGKRLSNIDAHDIMCKIGDVVVMGGVRRSAMISLSDLDDPEMRDAKKGQFYLTQPQRSMANNSAVYNEKPTSQEFLDEWLALAKSGSGERGIFNRGGLEKQLPARRWKIFKDYAQTAGTNPCGEIVLKSREFCNLTEIVARAEDTEESLIRKTRIASILGTYQSMLTHFGYLSEEWRENCEEERLLGVSITGQWDCPTVRNSQTLKKMREEAVRTNREYAKRFTINPSVCVTCVKPSGTLSQLVDASSGMHPRHSQYYIRRIRISATDSLFKMVKDQGVPYHPEVGQTMADASTYVLEFPVKASDGGIFRDDLSAIEQLEYWKMVKENYTEHNPSVTISIGDNEWIQVANWLYENWDILGGLSFLPRTNHVYRLAPYEEITKEQYEEMMKRFVGIDYSKIVTYEKADETEGAKELACVAGVCEI